ncbi:MAG: hypothetical protein HKM96_05055 [Boseongicola sp.]|nr:hypothetical protein [Silicimonas sp.]NNF90730.1 hypothetical protein [Boseongicola sp.]RZW07697.1 MAG: hypothetical protein EX266_06135 [Paracoccaceae bacterium]
MKYVTITTWEMLAGVDFDLTMARVREKRLPALRQLGAERIQVIRTSERTIAAISQWPDKTTRDSAAEFIERVRKDVRTEDHSRMTGEMLGEVVAEI